MYYESMEGLMVPLVDCFSLFFVHILSNQGVNMCGHQQDSMFFTLSFIKMSHLKVWSDDRSASLKIRKQRH